MDLIFQDWGLIEYEKALQRQIELVETVHKDSLPGYLIFCTHHPVVTLGRATKPEDVFGWKGRIIEISRGGRATYHGPSQLVVYPILNLTHERKGRKSREIVGYLRLLEEAIVQVLQFYGIDAQGRSLQKNTNANSQGDETGVWVGPKKIASLGIAVRKWITFHGAAINLTYDPQAFQGMNPCGFKSETMVSLEQLLSSKNNCSFQADPHQPNVDMTANSSIQKLDFSNKNRLFSKDAFLNSENFKYELKNKLLTVL